MLQKLDHINTIVFTTNHDIEKDKNQNMIASDVVRIIEANKNSHTAKKNDEDGDS